MKGPRLFSEPLKWENQSLEVFGQQQDPTYYHTTTKMGSKFIAATGTIVGRHGITWFSKTPFVRQLPFDVYIVDLSSLDNYVKITEQSWRVVGLDIAIDKERIMEKMSIPSQGKKKNCLEVATDYIVEYFESHSFRQFKQ